MNRRYPLLALLSLFVVALTAWNCTMELRYTGLPFALEPITPHAARVARLHGLSLPAGLHQSDRVEYARQSVTTRMDLLDVVEEANMQEGRVLPLFVTHVDGRHSRVNVPTRDLHAEPTLRVSIYLGFTWYLLLCLIILVTLWRGRDRTAWGIVLWGIAFQFGMACTAAPSFDQIAFGLGFASQIGFLFARIGFFIMADAIAAPALGKRARRVFLYAFVLSLVIGYAYELVYVLRLVYGAVLIPQIAASIWVLPYAIATAMLLAAHHGAAPAARPRLRWMFWSAVVLVFGILLSNVPLFGYPTSLLIEILAYIIAFAGLLYSVLRHRVVDMTFVLNRAIVYSVTLTIVVAVFMLLESFLEKIALSESASFALELGVPLVIGFSLEAVRKRLERLGELLLFRRKFKNNAALHAFAHQCSYIENPDRLLEQTMRELRTHADTPAVALYWQEQEGYRRLAEAGGERYPTHLDADDRAIVALRAEREATNLEDLASALGADGLLMPMIIRGELLGAIVIANRPGEHYAPDERELLEHLVHEVGSTLHALHARENARLVTAIAEGKLSGAETFERARALMPLT